MYTHIDVDEDKVTQMLNKRSAAKQQKDYATADAMAAELQGMNVCYVDEKREWYTSLDRKTVRAAKKAATGGAAAAPAAKGKGVSKAKKVVSKKFVGKPRAAGKK